MSTKPLDVNKVLQFMECSDNPQRFLKIFFREVFTNPFDQGQIDFINKTQSIIENGTGFYDLLGHRATGNTSRIMCLAIWAALYGENRNVILVTSSSRRQKSMKDWIIDQFKHNPHLQAAWPEFPVCFKVVDNKIFLPRDNFIQIISSSARPGILKITPRPSIFLFDREILQNQNSNSRIYERIKHLKIPGIAITTYSK